VPAAGVAPKVTAEVEAKVDPTVVAPLKASLEATVRGGERPRATAEVKHRQGGDRSYVVLDSNRRGVSADAGHRGAVRFEAEATGQAGPRHADAAVQGSAHRAGKAQVSGHARTGSKPARIERSVRKASREVAATEVPGSGRTEDGPPTPLQAIGREVANATGLLHVGWLTVLAAAGGLGGAGLARRLQRTL
jgi:hypothetical protein